MSQDGSDHLKSRIRELEHELEEREKDLAVFRRELTSANRRLEVLISEMNQELKVVHTIQKLIVPTEIPNIQGFDFSSKFVPSFLRGGDYFDIFEHEDRSRFGLIVASSSGHTMSALLLSVLLKFTGQMEARRSTEPHLMMRQIATDLSATMTNNDSADLFYGVFDRRQFVLSYAFVGDIVALHFDHASHQLNLLKSEPEEIRKESKMEFKLSSVALNPKDKLIFCTKGLIEAKNLDGQEFGRDRLYKSILEYAGREVHELRNQILFKVQHHMGGQEPIRDLTVVVAEVKDRVIKLAKK
jgi:sigma-B regulation protein RsbU (phosphoserine phosphatase)